ncbi:hypothetical protein [Escherichia coli]|uniref:hypothetical protein n=1 Tax=Escherichia coli TaxID=562 RepID=UPI001E4A1420|nr:hypothetical protein [Escherichia coli]ELS7773347.1 hypothetical protein [Escherichia coli]
MNDKELTKTPSPARKKQRTKVAHESESERFAPCAFALEKYLKEYSTKERTLQLWQQTKPH